MSKKKALLIATVALAAMMVFPAYAGWEQDEKGYWYMFDSGSYARSQIVGIDGVNYAFDQQAYMVKGWYNVGADWYYFSPESGAQVTGWQQVDGTWYYLNPANSGIMQKSWFKQANKLYYFEASGAMKTGAFIVDGYYYFAESDGSLRRNQVETQNGVTIRYDDDGKQWYKNAETTVNSQNGGDGWLPVLEDSALIDQRREVQESNQEYIEEKKDELYENFKEEVSKSTGTKSRQNKIEKWKTKANTQLKKLALSQQEIDDYIREVVSAEYGDDNGSWEYEYTEKNADGSTTTWKYTYRGSYYYD